jgi:hypothetical protein
MDRRRFLKSAAGLFIPAAPALILPKLVRAQGGMGPGPGMVHSTGGGALGLQTSLGAFFSLDNTLADATGTVTNLTNNNTVTFVSSTPSPIAAVSNTAKFVSASSQSLSHLDATGINVAGIDFSLQCWAFPTNNTNTFLSKNSGSFGNREYQLQYPFGAGSSNPVRIDINSAGAVASTANVANNAWIHIVITFNNTSKATIIYVNGSSAASATSSVGAVGTSDFYIGANTNGGAPSGFMDGGISLVGIWRNRILSAGDVTLLYNSGAGLSYAAMA